jgi:formate-dependent nitrite reductase membrane component NrfD
MKKTGIMPYEWMVKYTPEEEWIKGQGMLLWLAFFFSEIGAGIYFVSLFMNFRPGWLVGWLVTLVLGGLIHVAYLGKPMRSWRIFFRPANSELSRGLWVILCYAVVGVFQVLPVVFSALPWTGESSVLKIIMGIICVLLITHGFMMMSVVRAIPFWNSSMMVPLSVVSGIWVGSQAVLMMMYFTGLELSGVELWARWSLLAFITLLAVHLWGAAHSSEAATASLERLLVGDSSWSFYIGVMGIGIIIPLIITLMAWSAGAESLSGGVIFLRFLCILIGDLMMRYNIMRSGLYTPLIPRRSPQKL